MGMIVQHNMNALNAYNRLNANVAGMKKASEKLSSGYRINRAGDDAAGLAVSEKMRSQIKGLNQAIRNSQDGINMIQTFEGAAQETHSILQRMKELAVESANGTYDNATDRAAMQLEFDQLNDELNQIADTDFNGTIVLNGGEMSDGLKVSNLKDGLGEFNYREASAAAGDEEYAGTDVTAYVKTKAPTANQATTEAADKILDNSNYKKADADAIWEALGIDGKGVGYAEVTFVYDGAKWNAAAVTNTLDKKGGTAVDVDADPSGLKTTATANGGFTIDDTSLNAIFNSYEAKKGDYVTFSFENNEAPSYAPTNQGVMEDSVKITSTAANTTFIKDDLTFKVELEDAVKGEMDQDKKDLLDALNSAKLEVEWKADGTSTVKITDATALLDTTDLTPDKDGKVTILAADGTTKLASITLTNEGGADKPGATDATLGSGDDADALTVDASVADGDYTYVSAAVGWKNDAATAVTLPKALQNAGGNVTAAAGDKLVITGGDGTIDTTSNVGGSGGAVLAANTGKLTGVADGTYIFDGTDWCKDSDIVAAAKITGSTFAANDKITVGQVKQTIGKIEFQLNIDGYDYQKATGLEAHAIATSDDALAAAQGSLRDAQVSKSDAFKNSEAIMSYANHIVLQTGARTKDAVDFSFKYNIDDTADMGDLEANLNLSARKGGLETAYLSISNQKDANYAIDQIDKAINKTSMVRATFGSIQNRLEHKITNLTTTAENLTEAESAIRDTDMASEMMNYTKFNILQQAAQSMLAQANQQPQSILQLLG